MKKKKKEETRGRKSTLHKPVKEGFEKVLEALADSIYKEEKKLKKKK